MHPPLNRKTILNTNARHIAGRFAFCYFPQQMLSGLTKVNKASAICLEPMSCRDAILLSVKPGCCNLYKELTKSHSPEHMQYSFVSLLAPLGVGVDINTTDMFSDFNILQVISRGQ